MGFRHKIPPSEGLNWRGLIRFPASASCADASGGSLAAGRAPESSSAYASLTCTRGTRRAGSVHSSARADVLPSKTPCQRTLLCLPASRRKPSAYADRLSTLKDCTSVRCKIHSSRLPPRAAVLDRRQQLAQSCRNPALHELSGHATPRQRKGGSAE